MEEPLVDDPLQAHFNAVVKGMFEGRVVPLLGAGVNLCGRPERLGLGARRRHVPAERG